MASKRDENPNEQVMLKASGENAFGYLHNFKESPYRLFISYNRELKSNIHNEEIWWTSLKSNRTLAIMGPTLILCPSGCRKTRHRLILRCYSCPRAQPGPSHGKNQKIQMRGILQNDWPVMNDGDGLGDCSRFKETTDRSTKCKHTIPTAMRTPLGQWEEFGM